MERPELTGTLITLEFGMGGRIYQLWAADPTIPDANEEFQFVLGPVSFGEEFSEDYYPGTILLGARMQPDEPWIVSRNANVEIIDSDDLPGMVQFEYEFSFLPEIRATGRFFEIGAQIPQICWELRLENQGRQSLEIGELGFPFPFYNLMQGASRDERGGKNPYQDRVYIHKFVGGAASYMHAVRMSNEPPGLIICPGEGTAWEMIANVPRSLNTPYHWEGIPVAYVFSRATIDREGWSSHPGEHTSLILEPGDYRVFQTRMVPTSTVIGDPVYHTLAACGRPALRTLPAAVAPAEVGIAIEVGGVSPTKFVVNKDVDIETDSDEMGGFCFVHPKRPGIVRLGIEDTNSNRSYAHLLFIEPIADLIQKRAKWITDFQYCEDPESSLHHAFLLANMRTHEQVKTPSDYAFGFPVESGLADTLFLAEKNVVYPVAHEIELLEASIRDYIRDDLQNPSNGQVGSVFADFSSVALNYSRPRVYPLVFNLYDAMYRIGRRYKATQVDPLEYLRMATSVAEAFFRVADRSESGGMPTFSRIIDLIGDLYEEGIEEAAESLRHRLMNRARTIIRQPLISDEDLTGDTARFEEVFWAARLLDESQTERIALEHAFACRDLGPNWWSYASDYRVFHETEGVSAEFIADKGQLMLGHTTIGNSLMYFEMLDEDYMRIDDVKMRMAFGGMLGPWALIRPDGAASMGYCPDPASKQFGANPLSGDIGVALFQYLRRVRSIVLPSHSQGVSTFGCHFEIENGDYVVRPWDGVGRRLSLRQISCDVAITSGRIDMLRLDARKRKLKLTISNPTDFDTEPVLVVRGLWGNNAKINETTFEADQGVFSFGFPLPKRTTLEVPIDIVS